MSVLEEDAWDGVRSVLEDSKGISFDGCHKIYILMDEVSYEKQKEIGYGDTDGSQLIPTADDSFEVIQEWWADSCWLRFINKVDQNDILPVIDQGAESDWQLSYAEEEDSF